MTSDALPPMPDHTALCVAAFLTDTKCKRLLRRLVVEGTPVLTLQLTETVLLAIGFDPRSWRDWTGVVVEAANVAEAFSGLEKKKRAA